MRSAADSDDVGCPDDIDAKLLAELSPPLGIVHETGSFP
jgi:hypothetical protein